MLLAPFLWISCEFDEKVLDNLSLELKETLCFCIGKTEEEKIEYSA